MFEWLKEFLFDKEEFTNLETKTILADWENEYDILLSKDIKGFSYELSRFRDIEPLTHLLYAYDKLKENKAISVRLEYKARIYKKYINQLVVDRFYAVENTHLASYTEKRRSGTARFIVWFDVL